MVGHKSNHMCNSSQHLCPETCFLFNKSRGCQKLCKHKYNHPDTEEHICSLERHEHKCDQPCSLSTFTRKDCCKLICCLPAGHEEKEHICMIKKRISFL